MKIFLFALTALAGTLVLQPASAQDKIYRCGNEYTNNVSDAKARGCKLVEGGNVTVLQATKPAAAPAATSPANAPKVSDADQKARDSDRRAILQDELRKAEGKLAELRKEYNGGAPQKSALELRNTQVYQDRVTELKANMDRAQADVDGIRRELDRTK
ncbi:MAG: hypothetical protein ABS45_04690 [Comamonas sp. SCN 65-56]|uniref:hypothetical protein n=1 Tax=Comamonas sp. SCN 65-56 TaxID=1660095 RepID=UPI00086F0A22|nr:hypothetical protein [Comamonas sp. SCN 65-56]ODS92909.1 MAG: hypothetical protein ABS45_04690 [Comamonas sp. SCN 65-56]